MTLSRPGLPEYSEVGTVQRSLSVNITTIYMLGFFHSFMLVVPVFVPLVQAHGLSMAQVLQTQALYALTIACLEVPSGYIADVWGRRRAILVGSAFNGAGCLWLFWADSFGDFLVYEFVFGVGVSLISGADLALLYDSEQHLAESGAGGAGSSRSLSRLIAIEAGASGLAGLAASLVLLLGDMRVLLALQAISGFVPLLLALRLLDTPRARLTQGHSGNARLIASMLLQGKTVVLWTAMAIVAFGLLALYAFWIYQKYWELHGVPVTAFGYLWAVFALTVSVAARYAGHLELRIGWRRLLLLTAVLPLLGLLGMAAFGGWGGVLCGIAVQVSRGLSLTLFYEALNRRIPGDFRATVNSLVSLGTRGLFIVSGPLLGWGVDTLGMRTTLIALLIVFTPLLAVLMLGLSQYVGREHRAAAESAAVTAPAG